MQCSSCGSDKVIRIDLTLHTEEQLLFHSCHNCENRWWLEPDVGDATPANVPLHEVLNRATIIKTA